MLLAAGCSKQSPVPAQAGDAAPFKMTVQLDWVAEPEHGAFYTAEALGYFRDEGLDVTLLQGGPNAYALGQGGNQPGADRAVRLHEHDARDPGRRPAAQRGGHFSARPERAHDAGGQPGEDLGRPPGPDNHGRPEWAFLPYLRQKYSLDFQVIPQNFDLGRLAVDPSFIQQGYYIAEPYQLARRGVSLKFLYAWDSGFDAYTSVITNRTFAREHGDRLRAFLRALHRGYVYYIEKDPAPAHAIMLRINPKATADYLNWSRQQIINAKLDRNESADYLEITADRYRRQIAQLEDLGILPRGALKVGDVMDASFLPGK